MDEDAEFGVLIPLRHRMAADRFPMRLIMGRQRGAVRAAGSEKEGQKEASGRKRKYTLSLQELPPWVEGSFRDAAQAFSAFSFLVFHFK